MKLRFDRVEAFLDYLLSRENSEKDKYNQGVTEGILGQTFMPAIISQYKKERDWIIERITEKAERQPDDKLELDTTIIEFKLEDSPPLNDRTPESLRFFISDDSIIPEGA